MLVVGEQILKSALMRKESRGCHFLMEVPVRRKEFERHFVVGK